MLISVALGSDNATLACNLQQQQQASSHANRDKASKSLDAAAIFLHTLQQLYHAAAAAADCISISPRGPSEQSTSSQRLTSVARTNNVTRP